MTTIQDVARHAGVSVSTISNVLNVLSGRMDRMRQDTLQRVQAAIAALDYRPNRAAREIETSAQERHGHYVLLGNTYRNKDKETGFFEGLLAHGARVPMPEMTPTIVERVIGRIADLGIATGEFLFEPEVELRESAAAPKRANNN